jgi:ankyrin repeat protein/Ca2+-binding EF-hand superfamily protein
MSSALEREQEQKELAVQPDQSLLKRLAENAEEVAENRSSGFDLSFERMRSRRTGGAFVEKDQSVRLGLQDVIEKGQSTRTEKRERFLEPGSARTLAYQFAELEGAMERFLEFEAAAERERQVDEEDARKKEEEENAARRQHEEIEAMKQAEIERAAAMVQSQTDEWEAAFYAPDPLEREPTTEDIAKLMSIKMDLAASDSEAIKEMNDPEAIRAGTTARPLDIPVHLQDACRLPEELEQLIALKKQFNEIDFDHSGQIDAHELRTALKKLGITMDDAQLRTLLAEGDQSDDAELDFEEFIAFIKRFESSQKELSHMTANRKGLIGLADVMANIDLQKTDDGLQVGRKHLSAWSSFMEYPDPLHWAAGKGDLLAVKQFLSGDEGAPIINPDRVNKDGKMPLHYAAIWRQKIIMQYLLDPAPHGANVHIDPSDSNYTTPLFMSAEQGVPDTVDYLWKRWANIVQTNRAGATPLHSAANLNHSDVVEVLVQSGAIVSGSDDQTIRLWAIDDVKRVRILESDRAVNRQTGQMGAVYCMQVDQDRIATGHVDGTVRYSSITTQQQKPYCIRGLEGTRVFKGHTSTLLCLKVQPTDTTTPGHFMVTGSEDCTVRLWDIETAACVKVYEDKRPQVHPSAVVAVDLDVGGDRIVSGTRQGLYLIFCMSSGEILNWYSPHLGTTVNVAQLRGPLVMTAANDRTIRMLNMDSGKARSFHKHESGVTAAVWIDDEHWLAQQSNTSALIVSGSNTGEIMLWDWNGSDGKTVSPIKTFAGGGEIVNAHKGPVYDLKVVHSGSTWLLLSSSAPESGIAVWDFLAPEGSPPLHRLTGHKDDIRCIGWYGVDVNLTDPRGMTALMLAAERGLEKVIARLLGCAGINVWLGDKQYCETAIHRAARYGHVGCMRQLLQFDPALIYACTADNSTVLHCAVESEAGAPACVRLAMEYGAEINLMDSKGESPLHRAAALGRYRVLHVLAQFETLDIDAVGADHPIGGMPLIRPAKAPPEHRFPRLVKMPVQFVSSGRRWTSAKGADAAAPLRRKAVAVKEFMTLRHHLGWTALHMACAMGRPPAVKVLIDIKADVNREDDAGRRPLHLAAANGIPDQLMLLLRAKADCNARDCMGATPLHYAVKVAQEDAVKMLVRMCGAALDIDSEEAMYGLTALHMAAKYGLEDITFLLLDAGANVNAPDRHVCTPLHHAVASFTVGTGDPTPPTVPTVIKVHGFNVAATDKALSWLKMWDEGVSVIKGFSDARLAELRREVQSKYGNFVDTAQNLLDASARFDLKDATGRTAIEYAHIDYEAWQLFKPMFDECSADGKTYLVKGDHMVATYLGERGTKFEHGNLWQLVSSFGVRCLQGFPRMNGSRAFKKSMSKFSPQEVDYRALGELKIGQAGELQRVGCTTYVLSLEYTEDFTGLRKHAHSFLCAWQVCVRGRGRRGRGRKKGRGCERDIGQQKRSAKMFD